MLALAFSMVTYGMASQDFTTDVTLVVGGQTNPPPGGSGSGTTPGKPGDKDPGKPNTPGGNDSDGSGGTPSGPSNPSNPGSSGSPSKPSHPSGGGSGGGSRPSKPKPVTNTAPTPSGKKPGGVDGNGKPYYLKTGIGVRSAVYEKGYMYGYKQFIFGPDTYLTRGQFAVIMDRVFEFKDKTITKSFEDTRGHWTEESVNLLASRGIILGVSESEFRPDDPLTRGHVLLMLSRVLEIEEYSKVSNLTSVKQYHAAETIARMMNSGIYDQIDSDFNINLRITRGEMVHLLNNIIYERNAKNPKTEALCLDHAIFMDLTDNPYHKYYNNCMKALDYDFVAKEAAKLA